MFSNTILPGGSLYDPESKIKNYIFNEDIEYIRLTALQDGILFTDPNFYYSLGDEKEWKRPGEICSNPYFINGKPERFDALQGFVGDCWFMAAMEALTMNTPLIRHVVPPSQVCRGRNYTGAFHFRIWRLGTWYDVVVDDRLPVRKSNNKPFYAHSRSGDVFWACLLEKAYAKASGNTYESLWSGFPSTALQDFSGGIVERIIPIDPPYGVAIKWLINRVFQNDALMCCSCYQNVNEIRTDLKSRHTYCITNVFKCEDHDPIYPGLYLIRIMNPYGYKEWKGDWSDDYIRWREIDRDIKQKFDVKSEEDGEFWMGENDFVKYFNKLYVCHLSPGQYEQSRMREKVETWKTTTFWGEWVKGISAVGWDRATRHQNPQYTIELTLTDDSNKDGYVSVVIELTQRSKDARKRALALKLRVYVYSLNDLSYVPKPLDYKFIQSNIALNEYDVSLSEWRDRSYATRMKLDPGKYCIVPCTENKNEEQQFMLRIWSESVDQAWEYDTKISKSLPNKEEGLCKTDDGLRKMFYDLANNQNEVDWATLKNILETSINKNQSWFAFIKTCYKCIWAFFDTFIPPLSHNDGDTGDVMFSKDACRNMIAMFDDDCSGKLNFIKFSHLWEKISVWTEVYYRHVSETEGSMKVSQLREALSSVGYNLNKQIIHVLIHFYANDEEEVTVADFILCGINLETGMSLYQKRYLSEDKITFNLEEWLTNTLFL